MHEIRRLFIVAIIVIFMLASIGLIVNDCLILIAWYLGGCALVALYFTRVTHRRTRIKNEQDLDRWLEDWLWMTIAVALYTPKTLYRLAVDYWLGHTTEDPVSETRAEKRDGDARDDARDANKPS